MLKLTFDDPKQVLDLGAYADFELLGHNINNVCIVQRSTLAKAHDGVPFRARHCV